MNSSYIVTTLSKQMKLPKPNQSKPSQVKSNQTSPRNFLKENEDTYGFSSSEPGPMILSTKYSSTEEKEDLETLLVIKIYMI